MDNFYSQFKGIMTSQDSAFAGGLSIKKAESYYWDIMQVEEYTEAI